MFLTSWLSVRVRPDPLGYSQLIPAKESGLNIVRAKAGKRDKSSEQT